MNDVPDPLLAGKELPTFKFALEKSEGKVIGNSYGKEATVAQLPISKGIADVSMKLETGAMRELHWHPNADEWQHVLAGKVSVTLFGSGGRFRTETLETGDVGYIPLGYGHSLENVGDTKCRVLIGFNSGIDEDIDPTEWMAGNPVDVLATKPATGANRSPRVRRRGSGR
jgi:oxalate decarboxylase